MIGRTNANSNLNNVEELQKDSVQFTATTFSKNYTITEKSLAFITTFYDEGMKVSFSGEMELLSSSENVNSNYISSYVYLLKGAGTLTISETRTKTSGARNYNVHIVSI